MGNPWDFSLFKSIAGRPSLRLAPIMFAQKSGGGGGGGGFSPPSPSLIYTLVVCEFCGPENGVSVMLALRERVSYVCTFTGSLLEFQ